MQRIGIIGIGFMGMTHFEGATQLTPDEENGKKRTILGTKLNGGEVTAIATRNASKLAGDWTSIQGNFGPRGGHVDLSELKTYSDYHDLLADPEIDLVDLCLPTDQHESIALEALAAGKHVLVEKPIAIELDAADRMVRAAEEAGKRLMVAHVLPFFPEFQFAADCIREQRYGKLRAAHFRRVIAEPDWSSGMSDFRKLGGWGIDLHIHDNHFISLACGVPRAVFARGILQDGFVNHLHSNYLYDDGELAVSSVSGGIAASGLAFAHGFEIYLDEATILYEAGTYGGEWVVDRPLSLLTNDGKNTTPELSGGTEWCAAFTAELQHAVDCLNSDEESPILSGQLAQDALKICYAEADSIAGGQPIEIG